MNSEILRAAFLLAMAFTSAALFAASDPIDQLEVYRQMGVKQSDPARGRQLWYATAGQRSCTSCHGDQPANSGKHIQTGKVIEPMARSVNPERFQSSKKIEKWFLRNCKWTFGRQCSTQEKADILTWLSGQ